MLCFDQCDHVCVKLNNHTWVFVPLCGLLAVDTCSRKCLIIIEKVISGIGYDRLEKSVWFICLINDIFGNMSLDRGG